MTAMFLGFLSNVEMTADIRAIQLGSGQMGRQSRRGDRNAPAGKPRAKQVARP
jgi:hypothetical protein